MVMDPRFQDPMWLAGNCDTEIPFERACAAALRRQHEQIQSMRDALGLVELWMRREREALVELCGWPDETQMLSHEVEVLTEHDSRLQIVTNALRQSRAPALEAST